MIPFSPADNAGLLPYGDYIVGTPEGNVQGEGGLGELVEDFLSRSLRLYVYNHEYAVTRLVEITPSRSWGGSGALGCVLGFGALHRLPVPLAEPPAAPGEMLFETARFSAEQVRGASTQSPSAFITEAREDDATALHKSNLLVPAAMTFPPPAPLASASASLPEPTRTGRKTRNGVPSGQAFDEYFKEGEEKSKEEDLSPAGKSTPPPPPPKGGGPPPKTQSPEAKPELEGVAT